MDLVDAATLDLPPYTVEVSTSPSRVQARAPFTLRLVVHQPDGAVASRFDLVHEMWYHLFIVSDDLTVYQHVHPEPQPDQSWRVDVTLPADGHYSLLSDFVPAGATPQFIRSTLATAGAEAASPPHPGVVPGNRTARTEHLAASLAFSPAGPAAGRVTRMTYRLTDPETGVPTIDLQPYLGAFGHSLVVRDGVSAWVHSHPVDDGRVLTPRSRGGPEVAFDAWFATPGRYRAWTQFMRGGEIQAVSFTFDVRPQGLP
jgi:hypothetical protein